MAERARIAIVTDSTSDLTPETQERYGITVVPLNVHFGQQSFKDQIDLTTDQFMTRLASAPKLPSTSQPSVGLFEETFRRLANDYNEIVCILISSRLSGTVQSASLAAEAVADVITVEVVDSQNCSYGLGFQAIRAVELAGSAHSAAEVAAQLVSELNAYQLVLFVDTLAHLAPAQAAVARRWRPGGPFRADPNPFQGNGRPRRVCPGHLQHRPHRRDLQHHTG